MTRKPQTIFRVDSASERYTIISDALLQDQRLNHETKGLLCELLSRPKDWEITIRGIVASGKSGRDKVYRMIEEATQLGYIKPDRERAPDGTLGRSYYTVRDQAEPLTEKPEVAPLPGKPLPGNPPQQITESNKKQIQPLRARARDLIEDEKGLVGEGFELSWPQIDLTADLYALPRETARTIAKTLALEWNQGKPPKSALATLRRALREEQTHNERGKARQAPREPRTAAKPAARDVAACEHGFTAGCSLCRAKRRQQGQVLQ